MSDSLEELRERMDVITLSMLSLLKVRMDISAKMGDIKKSKHMNISNIQREDTLRNMVLDAADGLDIPQDIASRFLNYLVSESIKVQSRDSPTHLAVFARAKKMEREGRRIIHMEVGEPDFKPPAGAGKWLQDGFDAGHTRYGLPQGMASLRAALAENTPSQAPLTGDNVLVTPGARFAVFAAITTILRPGDEVIIINPAWPAYQEAATYCGAKLRIIRTTLEQQWIPSLSEIENAITRQTKMIILCYPSNPTGIILPKSTMNGIMEIAMRKGIYVLGDEIYDKYCMDGFESTSVLDFGYERSIAVQSFSKSHAMMGFRVGYAISAPDTISRMAKVSALCLTGVAGVVQYAALQAIHHDTSKDIQTVLDRLKTVTSLARDTGLEFAPPRGAMYLFARYPGMNGMEIIDKCLERGLALAPGIGFGNYPDFIRISAGSSDAKEGMHILHTVLHDNT